MERPQHRRRSRDPTFTVQVTDSAAPTPLSDTQLLSITIDLRVTTSAVANGQIGTSYTATLAATGGSQPYSWALAGGTLPQGLTVNPSGVIGGTPSVSGIFSFAVRVTDGLAATASTSLSITVPLSVTTNTLPNGTVGTAYVPQTLTASAGGTTPYIWSVVDTNLLPPPLVVSAAGIITGTPTTAGTFTFEVTAQAADMTLTSAPQQLTITVLELTTTLPLPNGEFAAPYAQTLTVTGGTAPYSWTRTGGSLPQGLLLAASGLISGTPSVSGKFDFTVQVTDSLSATASQSLSITVPLSVTTNTLPNGTVGDVYVPQTLTASAGGTTPYVWSVVDTNLLPPPLVVSAAGVISGTPTTAGTFIFEVIAQASDMTLASAPKQLTISVLEFTTTLPLPNGEFGAPYAQTLSVTGGTTPYSWSRTGGSLPQGLAIATSGVISGTPSASGIFNFTVRVSDGLSATATQNLDITVPISVTTNTLPNGTLNAAYAAQILGASPGGTTPYQWSVVNLALLPPGLLVSASGTISGTPNAAGTFTFEVVAQAADMTLVSAPKSLTIVIGTGLSISTVTLPDATAGTAYIPRLLGAAGGTPPYTWAVSAGVSPPGLTISNTGVTGGTPSLAGRYSFDVTVRDSSVPQQTVTGPVSIAVVPVITTTSLAPVATAGTVYPSQSLNATPGTSPFVWRVSSGGLPRGLSLSGQGTLSGTPTGIGTFSFTISINDGSTPALTASRDFQITVQEGLVITTSSPSRQGVVGAFFLLQVQASKGTALNWSVISGILPPGITLNTSGTISGVPTLQGSFDFTVQASGGIPVETASRAFRLVILESLSITTPPTLPVVSPGSAYSVSLTANGGIQPYTWTNPSGTVPPGLSLSDDGVLSGTPGAVGSFTFTLQVADSYTPASTATQTFVLVVDTSFTISTTSLPSAFQDQAYNHQLQTAGGTGPFTWTVSSGALPTGLTLSVAGSITGTASVVGSTSFTVLVTDTRGTGASRDFSLGVDPSIPPMSVLTLASNLSPAGTSNIEVSLSASHPSPLTGQLNLAFTSIAEVPGDDPMTQFSSGSRVVDFTIPAGDTMAVFPSPVILLTGTVAGNVNLTANFDNGPSNVSIATARITPTAPQITNVTAVRRTTGLDVQIIGYAPMKRMTNVEFIFDVRVGNALQPISLSRSVDPDFTNWYTNPASLTFGSSFSFLQAFTIAGGSINAIESVTAC